MSVQQEEIETSKMSDKELIAYLMKKNAQLEQKNLKTEEKLKNALSKAKVAETEAKNAQAKAKEAEDKANEAEAKAKDAEDKANEAEAKAKDAEKRAHTAENQLAANIVVMRKGLENINEIISRLHRRNYDIDKVMKLKQDEAIDSLLKDFGNWVNNAKSWLGLSPFIVGGESIGSSSSSTTVDSNATTEEEIKKLKELQKQAAQYKSNSKAARDIIDKQNELVIKIVESLIAKHKKVEPWLESMYNLAKKDFQNTKPPKKKSPGKQAKNHYANARKDKSTGKVPKKCRKCQHGEYVPVGQQATNLIAEINRTKERLEPLTLVTEIYQCTECGDLFFLHDENTPHPVYPNYCVDCLSMIRVAELLFQGIPVNRFEAAFIKEFGAGKDVIQRSLHKFVQFYLKPLQEQIIEELKGSPVLICDETSFRVLEDMGMGLKGHQNLQAEENENENEDSDDKAENKKKKKPRSKTYITALTSGPSFQHKLSVYNYIGPRSTEALGKVLLPYTNCEYLITDGYSGYQSLIKKNVINAKQQCCLVHIRREFFKALCPKEYVKQFENMNDDEIGKFIKDGLTGNSPHTHQMLCILDAFSKIYALETLVDYQDQGPKNQSFILNIRAKQAGIIHEMGIIVREIAKGRVKKSETSDEYSSLNSSDLYAKACVYFLNQEKQMKTFLESTIVAPDSNWVENQIRPTTMLRKVIYHKNTVERMNDLAIIYSVFQTLHLNGIDAESFLKAYCSDLYFHCLEAGYTKEHRENDKSLDKQIRNWETTFPEYAKSFDFTKVLPFK